MSDPVLRLLESADRFPKSGLATPRPNRSAQDIFDQTIQTPVGSGPPPVVAKSSVPPWVWPAALGALLLVGGLAFLLTRGSNDTAAPQLMPRSGSLTIGWTPVTMPDGATFVLTGGSQTATYRFQDDDYSYVATNGVEVTELRQVAGVGYAADGRGESDGAFRALDGAQTQSERAAIVRIIGADPRSLDGNAVKAILQERATLAADRQADNGRQLHVGSIAVSELVQLEPSLLPPGLALYAGRDLATLEPLPEQIGYELTLANGALERAVTTISGNTSAGPIDLTITAIYAEFNQPQTITAPAAIGTSAPTESDPGIEPALAEPALVEPALVEGGTGELFESVSEDLDDAFFGGLDDNQRQALETVTQNQPELCRDERQALSATLMDSATIEAAAACLDAAGEIAAGSAIRALADRREFLDGLAVLDTPQNMSDAQLDAYENSSTEACVPDLRSASVVDTLYNFAACLDAVGETVAAEGVRAEAEAYINQLGGSN